jgi:hypothetical protein
MLLTVTVGISGGVYGNLFVKLGVQHSVTIWGKHEEFQNARIIMWFSHHVVFYTEKKVIVLPTADVAQMELVQTDQMRKGEAEIVRAQCFSVSSSRIIVAACNRIEAALAQARVVQVLNHHSDPRTLKIALYAFTASRCPTTNASPDRRRLVMGEMTQDAF